MDRIAAKQFPCERRALGFSPEQTLKFRGSDVLRRPAEIVGQALFFLRDKHAFSPALCFRSEAKIRRTRTD